MLEHAQTGTLRTSADRVIERKHNRLEFTNTDVVFGTGVVLREEYLIAADNVHESESTGQTEDSLKAVGHTRLDARLYDDTVNDYLDIVLLVLVELDILGKLIHYAVYANADEAGLPCAFELLCVLSLAVPDDRRKELHSGPLGELHNGVYHLVDALLGDDSSADRTVRNTYPRIEKSEVVVYLGNSSHGRTGVLGGGLLVYGYSRRESLYAVHIGLFHLSEEHSRVGRKALDIAALTVGVYCIEGEGGFSRTRQTCHNDELVTRKLEVDVLEVIFSCTLDYNFISHNSSLKRISVYSEKFNYYYST